MEIYQKEKRQFWVVLMIVFLGFIGISMPYLIFPSLFLHPENSFLSHEWSEASRAILLGITLAAYPFGQFLGSPILGSLSDTYGRKPLLASSLLIAALSNLLTGLAIEEQYLSLLIISRFIAGVMEGNIAIARAMASDMKSLSKHTTFGKINAAASIAYLIGPLIGGLMTDKSVFTHVTMATPFYFICFLFLGLGILSVYTLKNNQVLIALKSQSFWQQINIFEKLNRLFSNKRLQFLLLTSTCFTLAVDIFYEFGPVYLTVKWNLLPAQLIFYNGVLCIALAIGNGWLPHFVSTRFPSRLASSCAILSFGLFLIGIIWTDLTVVMLILYALSGLVIGLAVTLISVKISNAVSDNIQGEVMGVQLSLRVLGDAIICLLGGGLLLLSPKIILGIAAGLSFIAVSYYNLKHKKMSLT